MMTATGDVKLLDFGIAKAASHMRDDMTRTGTLKGKISYMSPEQAEGDPVDRRSDIFSLGIVLHELLTMRRVFRGEDDLQTLRRIRDANPPPPSSLRQDISVELDTIVLRMLARNRDDRFQSCGEVAQALAPIVRERRGTSDRQRVFVATLEMPSAEQVELLPSLDADVHEDHDDLPAELAELEVTMAQDPAFAPVPMARSGQIATPPPPLPALIDRTETTLSRTTGEMQSIEMSLTPRSHRRAVIVAGSCAAALIVALTVIRFDAARTPQAIPMTMTSAASLSPPMPTVTRLSPAAAPSMPSPPQLVVTAPAPAPVRLHVAGTDGAQVVQGDHVLGVVPLTTELPAQAGKRALVIRKPGFKSATRVVAGDAHAELEVELARLPKKPIKSASSEGQIKDPF
jgi:hypothetical protein